MEIYENEKLIEYYKKELEVNSDTFEVLNENIIRILGEDYWNLYDYFLELLVSDYDYKILMARRCLVLFQIFIKIFSLKEEELQVRGVILGDRAIPAFREKFKDKKILIADDILIHGRNVSSVYNYLMNECKFTSQVDIRVYMLNHESNCLNTIISRKIQYTEEAYEWSWKETSNRIIRSIMVSNVPYTSFIGAFSKRGIVDVSAFKSFSDVEIIKNSIYSQLSEKCESKVVFSKALNPNIFDVFSYISCIRVYTSETIDRTTMIPYSFTKSINSLKADEFFCKLANVLESACNKGSLCGNIIAEFKNDDNSSERKEYKVRLLNALISHLYAIYFFEGKAEINLFDYDYDTIARSFSEDIALDFLELNFGGIESIFKYNFEEFIIYFQYNAHENTELQKEYAHIMAGGYNKDNLVDYLFISREKDEVLAEEQKKRLAGISIDYILTHIPNNNLKRIAADILNTWDVGYASSNCVESEDKTMIESFYSAGEQSYRRIIEKYPLIIKQISFLEQTNIFGGDTEARRNKINEYIGYITDKWENDEADTLELKEFLNRYQGNIRNWDIQEIIEPKENDAVYSEIDRLNKEFFVS